MSHSYRLTWDHSARRCLPAPDTASSAGPAGGEAEDLAVQPKRVLETIDDAFTSLAMLLTGASSQHWRR